MVAKFIFILFKAIIKQYIKNKFKKKNREELVNEFNRNIDIPFINEKTEAKGIRTILKITEKWLIK